ncbi:competence/damage-inducible protein A [Sediminibacterium goheungense]|uniref:CinA-like protein n=1 Tax=Sediminibacterium goheungense TaxID=1086393 RepID=A0A4R6J021_9BACT|nr:competence/damage-inducible protein A [Sediminibacterium goheungense]TDO28071.1 competence/damage-inducible protein cinA [Sediminibacterium goheungense]
MEKVFASIITIGDELLIGQVIDTNSAWIAQELNKTGIAVKNRVAVGDVWEDIWQALDAESKKASIVLITGGLGPTADDITKPLLCEYFGGKMILHEETLAYVTFLFEKVFKRPMIERNRKQAEVPDVCTVLKNEKGTAPGMLFEKDGVIFISMPGVPHEMKWLMLHHVLPLVEKRFTRGVIRHSTLLTAGIGESFLAEMIADIELSLPSHIKLAYLPNYGMVRLRLTASGTNAALLEHELSGYFNQLLERTKDYLVIDEDIPMELVVGKLLKARNQTLSTAESCTGGYIAHVISKHSGASAYYTGSVVSYDNRIKTDVLSVPSHVLETVGAVSEATVKQMAEAVRKIMKTDYAIAVSGIMGPAGGTDTKPVGMVWIAVASTEKTIAQVFNFRFDRARNIELTATNALNLLRQLILGKL